MERLLSDILNLRRESAREGQLRLLQTSFPHVLKMPSLIDDMLEYPSDSFLYIPNESSVLSPFCGLESLTNQVSEQMPENGEIPTVTLVRGHFKSGRTTTARYGLPVALQRKSIISDSCSLAYVTLKPLAGTSFCPITEDELVSRKLNGVMKLLGDAVSADVALEFKPSVLKDQTTTIRQDVVARSSVVSPKTIEECRNVVTKPLFDSLTVGREIFPVGEDNPSSPGRLPAHRRRIPPRVALSANADITTVIPETFAQTAYSDMDVGSDKQSESVQGAVGSPLLDLTSFCRSLGNSLTSELVVVLDDVECLYSGVKSIAARLALAQALNELFITTKAMGFFWIITGNPCCVFPQLSISQVGTTELDVFNTLFGGLSMFVIDTPKLLSVADFGLLLSYVSTGRFGLLQRTSMEDESRELLSRVLLPLTDELDDFYANSPAVLTHLVQSTLMNVLHPYEAVVQLYKEVAESIVASWSAYLDGASDSDKETFFALSTGLSNETQAPLFIFTLTLLPTHFGMVAADPILRVISQHYELRRDLAQRLRLIPKSVGPSLTTLMAQSSLQFAEHAINLNFYAFSLFSSDLDQVVTKWRQIPAVTRDFFVGKPSLLDGPRKAPHQIRSLVNLAEHELIAVDAVKAMSLGLSFAMRGGQGADFLEHFISQAVFKSHYHFSSFLRLLDRCHSKEQSYVPGTVLIVRFAKSGTPLVLDPVEVAAAVEEEKSERVVCAYCNSDSLLAAVLFQSPQAAQKGFESIHRQSLLSRSTRAAIADDELEAGIYAHHFAAIKSAVVKSLPLKLSREATSISRFTAALTLRSPLPKSPIR